MHSSTPLALLASALASLSAVSAQTYDPIDLGYWGYPHGNQFIAWVPSKTTEEEACTTRTSIRTDNSGYPTAPICGTPFDIDGYTGLTLTCSDGETLYSDQVVGILDSTGLLIENCTAQDGPDVDCADSGENVSQAFACQ